MLTGIKTGKRKRKTESNDEATITTIAGSKNSSNPTTSTATDNQTAADELRKLLQSGSQTEPSSVLSSIPNNMASYDAIERFASRQNQNTNASKNSAHEDSTNDNNIVVITNGTKPVLLKEDLKYGARKGKLKLKDYSYLHAEEDKSILDMMREEKSDMRSMDEIAARNIARLGSKYKGAEYKNVVGSSAGVDEEDYTGDGGIDMKMYTTNDSRLTASAKHSRDISRQISKVRKENTIARRCFWWMESNSFEKHRLIALGNYVSLVMVPSHLALVPDHCWLVPIQHSESFVACENEVWDEVARFKASLQNMFEKEGKNVFYMETVLQSKGFWQTRMDVVPIPKDTEQDPEMAFKFAMEEQAEEWGTHTKVLSTREKGVRYTVPKGFPYFNVEWNGGGYAQIIESEKFPKDFGLDIIAGLLELDPMKFNRKPKATDQDRGSIMNFVNRWNSFDWTLSLD
jgi:hypothetical protein